MFIARPTVLESILNDLFHVFRYETCNNLRQVGDDDDKDDNDNDEKHRIFVNNIVNTQALDILLLAMERHNHEKHIQVK